MVHNALKMRLVPLGLLAAAIVPAQSMAAVGDTATLVIQGTIPPKCAFTTLPATSDIGAMTTGKATELGMLGFKCNLATSGAVSLTVRSQNGALKRDGGADAVAYQAAWDVQGRNDSYVDATAMAATIPFQLTSGTSGVVQSGVFKVKVTGATDTSVAGTYRDTITYTVSP